MLKRYHVIVVLSMMLIIGAGIIYNMRGEPKVYQVLKQKNAIVEDIGRLAKNTSSILRKRLVGDILDLQKN